MKLNQKAQTKSRPLTNIFLRRSTLVLHIDEKADLFRFLARVNYTSERMWKIFFKIVAVIITMNTVVLPLISFFSDPNSEVEKFHHPLPFVYVKISTEVCFVDMIFQHSDEISCFSLEKSVYLGIKQHSLDTSKKWCSQHWLPLHFGLRMVYF